MDEGLLKPGEVLNNTYRIEELVGEGGTGEVYRAINTASQRPVAIKILKAQFSQDPKFIDLMRRELLHNVSDGAVVRYYDLLRTAEDHGGLYFLVMDFIDGSSMADLMQKGPVSVDTLMILADRVAQGLAACHQNSIFHRDISPDNIILRDNDPAQATLIDFGIAKDVRPDAKTVVGGGFAGKYEYAAPEQLDGIADARSDIYSFGMTLLAAARGESPKLGTSFLEIVKAKHAPVDTNGIGEPLRGLIDAMVRPAPEDRPQSAAELLKLTRSGAAGGQPSIESFMEPDANDPPTRRVSDTGKKTPPPAKKKGKGGLIAAVLGLLIIGGGGAVVALKPELIPGLGETLPAASPYTFSASLEGGKASANGNVTSTDGATKLADALKGRLPISDEDIKLTPATGAPNAAWRSTVTAMAAEVNKLDQGELKFSDDQIRLSGEASSAAVKSDVEKTARSIAKNGGYRLALALTVPSAEDAERVRREQERLERERLAEQERLAAEQAEKDRLAKLEEERRARAEADAEELRLAEEARLKKEEEDKAKFAAALAAQQLSDAQKREEERKEAERVARERAEWEEQQRREQAARDLAEKERLEKERLAREAELKRLEDERIAAELAEAERLKKAQEEADRLEAARLEKEEAERRRKAAEDARREEERLAALKLSVDAVEGILKPYEKCGPLSFKPASESGYGPTETITITGFVASDKTIEDARRALGHYSGTRTIDTSGLEVVNDSVCIVIDVMPDEQSGPAELLFYSAKSGERVEVDALKPDDQAVVYVSTPKDLEGYLYVFVSDNEYGTFHLRPAQLNEENQLSKLGEVTGDERRVQLTWPLAQGSRKRPALAFTKPYGINRIFMLVLKDKSLFKHMRANEDTRELVPVLRKSVIEAILRGKILSHKQRFVLVDED